MVQDLFGQRAAPAAKLPETFRIVPVQGMRNRTPFLDFVKSDLRKAPPPPTPDYHPTAIYVACTKCRTVGTLMFPRGFDYGTGDAIMDGKIVKALCHTCRGIMEVRPITPKELNDNQLALLRRHYEIIKAWSVQTGSTMVDESAFIGAYEEKYGINGDPEKYEAERQRRAAEAADAKPRIVMP